MSQKCKAKAPFVDAHIFKAYDTEEILAAKVDADEKTFRKWVWICIELMAYLQVDFVSLSYSLIFHLF